MSKKSVYCKKSSKFTFDLLDLKGRHAVSGRTSNAIGHGFNLKDDHLSGARFHVGLFGFTRRKNVLAERASLNWFLKARTSLKKLQTRPRLIKLYPHGSLLPHQDARFGLNACVRFDAVRQKHVPVVERMVPEVPPAANVIILIADAQMLVELRHAGARRQAQAALQVVGLVVAIAVLGQLGARLERAAADVAHEVGLDLGEKKRDD